MNHRHQAAITSNLFDYNLLLNLRITKAKICFTLSFIIATIKACNNYFISLDYKSNERTANTSVRHFMRRNTKFIFNP